MKLCIKYKYSYKEEYLEAARSVYFYCRIIDNESNIDDLINFDMNLLLICDYAIECIPLEYRKDALLYKRSSPKKIEDLSKNLSSREWLSFGPSVEEDFIDWENKLRNKGISSYMTIKIIKKVFLLVYAAHKKGKNTEIEKSPIFLLITVYRISIWAKYMEYFIGVKFIESEFHGYLIDMFNTLLSLIDTHIGSKSEFEKELQKIKFSTGINSGKGKWILGKFSIICNKYLGGILKIIENDHLQNIADYLAQMAMIKENLSSRV